MSESQDEFGGRQPADDTDQFGGQQPADDTDQFGGQQPADDTDQFGGPQPADDTDQFGGPAAGRRHRPVRRTPVGFAGQRGVARSFSSASCRRR